MGAPSSAFRIDITYVFTGHPEKIGSNGQPVWGKNSLRPVQNLVVFTSDVGKDAAPGDLQPWCTDGKGLLRPIREGGAVHSFARTRRFIVPPAGVILQAWASNQQDAPEILAKLVAGSEGSPGVELTKQRIDKSHLAPADSKLAQSDPDEKAYAEFLNGPASSGPIFAYVLPRVRAVLLKFTNPAFGGASVGVIRPDGKMFSLTVKATKVGVRAVLQGADKDLPPGLYRFVIQQAALHGAWSSEVTAHKTYEIKARLRFHITNPAGEFDVVDCDPITVQDAVLLQFGTLYARLIAAAQQVRVPAAAFDATYREHPEVELPAALKAWGERLKTMKDRTSLAVDAVNGEDFASKLAKALVENLEPNEERLRMAKDGIVLCCDGYENVKDWLKLRKQLRIQKQIQGATPIVASHVKGFFEKRRWINYLSEKAMEKGGGTDLLKLSDSERSAFFKAGMTKERTTLEKALGDHLGKAIPKALTALELGLKGYDTALALNDVLEASKNLDAAKQDFRELCGKVDSELQGVPCKEAIGNLERRRALTIAAALQLDEREVKALLAVLDLALAVATTFVGGPLLAAIAVVKATYELVESAGQAVDRHLLHGLISAIYSRWDQINRLINASECNQRLLREAGANPTEVQFRLRAEAIAGLVGIITRASVSSATEAEYLDRIEKYRVEDYIRTFLLTDGWQIPLRTQIPIGMDAYWLYVMGKHLPLGFDPMRATQPWKAAQLAVVPGGFVFMGFVDALVAGHVRADFQKTFPIHHLESSAKELALALRTYWGEVKNKQIEYTCVYYRNYASTDDKEWTPVDPRGARAPEDLQKLTPLNAIRVLIVMDQTVKPGIYPLTLQVVRVDPWVNITGPVYKHTLRPLGDEDLLEHERAKFKGRMGCVVYPFYQFGNKVFPGLKPLNRRLLKEPDVFMHGLREMRYSLAVRAGSDSVDDWVNLGGPQCGKSALDELRIGFANSDAEELMARDPEFLVREAETFTYPRLFRDGGWLTGAGPFYVRVGGKGPYLPISRKQGGVFRLDAYDWKTPMELVVVVWGRDLYSTLWEKEKLDWKNLPVVFNLYGGGGPQCSGTLHHVGELAGRPDLALTLDRSVEDTDVADWAHQVSRPDQLELLGDTFYAEQGKSKFQIFAARVNLEYASPSGAIKQGLRPYGKMRTDDYSVLLANLQTPENSGLHVPTVQYSTFTGESPYVLKVPPPASYVRGVPWVEGVVGTEAQVKEKVAKWIERGAGGTRNDPTET